MASNTPAEVARGIVAEYVAGGSTNQQIADRFGVHVTTVSRLAKAFGVLRSKSEAQAVRASRDSVGWDRFGKKGAVQSVKTGEWHPCDSAYEYARMLQLDADPEVRAWFRSQHRVPYEFMGSRLLYVPDIDVEMVGGERFVEEVKPAKYLGQARNVAKFQAAKDYFSRVGISFRIITEAEIGWQAIRNLDGMPLNGVPEEERKQRRRDAALKHLRSLSPERRADYNLKAKIREAAKRAANREEYNRKAREYRAKRKARKQEAA